jgi:5-methylcytosine-specific restriction endonuclease McrA
MSLEQFLNGKYGKVLVEEPHPQSRASLVMLKKHLAMQFDPKDEKLQTVKWLVFRDIVLKEVLAKEGSLTCHYCKQENLLMESVDLDFLATLDHVVPVSKGGKVYDRANLVVACHNCNNNKGNK